MAIIRISGNHGAGKTTLGKRLAEEFGYRYENTGLVFRRLAAEQGLSIEEFYDSLKNNHALEKQIRQEHIDLMQKEDNLIIDSRTLHLDATPFEPCNILLTVRPEIGAKRIHQEHPEKYPSIEFAMKASRERLANEMARYREDYGVENFLDPKYFDIVLDTSSLSKEEVFKKVIEKLQLPLKQKKAA